MGLAERNAETIGRRTRLEQINTRVVDVFHLVKFAEGLTLAAIENFDPAHWHDVLLGGPRKKEQLENLKTIVRRVGQAQARKLVTSRQSIIAEDFFDERSVFVLGLHGDFPHLQFLRSKFPSSPAIEHYSLRAWLLQLLGSRTSPDIPTVEPAARLRPR